MGYNLSIEKILPYEIIHFYDSKTLSYIASNSNKFYFKTDTGSEGKFSLPTNMLISIGKFFRPLRRFLRTDKSNAFFNYKKDGIVVIYSKSIFFFDLSRQTLKFCTSLADTRNILHMGEVVNNNAIIFGEYSSNKSRLGVPIWASYDDGKTWDIIYKFKSSSIKHIHGIYEDRFSDSLWITSGDYDGECFLFEVPKGDFKKIIRHGDGSQKWRAVGLFFLEHEIIWAMDSHIQKSSIQIYNRKTKKLKTGMELPGPVWYSKELDDGKYLIQTSVENGNGSTVINANIYFSTNCKDWQKVFTSEKDLWPMPYFKNGVISFATGYQDSESFAFFSEGLIGIDGKSFLARVYEN